MKTQQLTHEKEKEERQKDLIDSNLHLEDDERILYSESTDNSGCTLAETATTLFLIFGFPFYIVIAFTALTAYLSEKTWAEFGQEIMWPSAILLVVAVFSIALGLALQAAYRNTLGGSGTKFFITNKRIYNYNPNGLIPLMFESRYSDVLYIYPEKLGKHEYLQVRVKELQTSEDGSRIVENRHAYHVKNAQKALLHIPDHVRWQCSEKSKQGAIYKQKTKSETVLALTGLSAVICFLAFMVVTVDAQVAVADLLHMGRKLVNQGQLAQAQRVYCDAYQKIRLFPFHALFGPAAYRYAGILDANGKFEQAIPVYIQAIEHCNWCDMEDGITWKPAVFRSNVRLAEIYRQKKNDQAAEKYFEQALAAIELETDENRVKDLFSNYRQFLKERGKGGKAAMVNSLAGDFHVKPQIAKPFSD